MCCRDGRQIASGYSAMLSMGGLSFVKLLRERRDKVKFSTCELADEVRAGKGRETLFGWG
jgi:hypothetical protein